MPDGPVAWLSRWAGVTATETQARTQHPRMNDVDDELFNLYDAAAAIAKAAAA
jgi:hypothetical protein